MSRESHALRINTNGDPKLLLAGAANAMKFNQSSDFSSTHFYSHTLWLLWPSMGPLYCLHGHAGYMRMRRYVNMYGAYAAESSGQNEPGMVCVLVRAIECVRNESDRIERDSAKTIDAKPLLDH